MTSWSQEEDLKLMLEVINQQDGLKIDWNKISTNMGRTVRAVNQHYDILKKKASTPGPPTNGNAATGDAQKRRAGQITAASIAKKKAKSSQAKAIQTGDEDDEEDMDDEEAVIPKLVAISKGAKRPHHEAVEGSSAKKAITQTALIDGDEEDGEDPTKKIPVTRNSDGAGDMSTGMTKKGSIKQVGLFDGTTIGGGTEAYKKKRVMTVYGDESTQSMPGRQKSRTKYLMEEEEKALESLGLQRDIKEEDHED